MNILIVDDIATNRKLLGAILEAEGHLTIEAADGIEALQILNRQMVDAVVSDILMPRMDGYRLCHEIRTNERLRDLPIVIYTSTYTSPGDEKLALDVGADKFLRKPSPVGTILAAMHDAIGMQHTAPQPDAWQQVEVLKEYSDRLVAKLEEKNVELVEANRRLTILDRSKSDFLNLISHELRTPLNGLFGAGEVILSQMPSADVNYELQGVFKRSRRRILSIVDDALLLTEIDVSPEEFKSGPVSLSVVLNRAMESMTEFAESRHVLLGPPPAGMGIVVGDEDLLVRAFQALLETAAKFSETGEMVRLSREVGSDSQGVIIESHGRSIPGPALEKFFELFSIGEAHMPSGHLGLAAAVAYRILALFGASVRVANREPSGIRLTVSLKDVREA